MMPYACSLPYRHYCHTVLLLPCPEIFEKPQPVGHTHPIVNIPPVKMQHLANAIGSISNQHPRASFSSVGIRVLQGAAASAGLTIQYREEAPGRRRQDRSAPSTPPAQAGTAPCAGERYCTMCTSTDGAAGGHGGAGSGGSRKRSLL